MKQAHKIVWTEGMFLRPHHFQQSVSYLERSIADWGMALHGHHWGFLELDVDQAALRQGLVALDAASGVMPDGTYFAFRGAREAPPPLALGESKGGQAVVLALPVQLPGREEVIFAERADSLARHLAYEAEVDDFNAVAVGSAQIQASRLRLRLMPANELNANWIAMGVVRVLERGADNGLRLDAGYIPPTLNCRRDDNLLALQRDLQGLLQQRSQQMGQRLEQAGRAGVSEIADFLLLQLINRHLGQVSHAISLASLHPERLFADWLALAGELATFTPRRMLSAGELPVYDHDDLAGCFGRLQLLLRQGLSVIHEDSALQIPIVERSHGLSVASLANPAMLDDFGFVLAARADLPAESLRTHLPAQLKVAPVQRIRDLVQLQLPGIALQPMPVAPRQIPYHSGFTYFEIERGGELWSQMERSGAFALHVAGHFPGLEMEFWAIRNEQG
ncbi:type VI secretion system protein ImpJ [Pseudomonas delhiensis]|uniref:Type VI secretion system protein ImpJ n=1 Tax=Pseudomonas delhiensis TaxID=366289 RepID=A0A239IA55_9PSED|nr:type VI secretion system baseplate subunit TssK [Pseudomonas delhiensis]SDK15984.1 type VI secretion system protein ImpJ [Pseudomonas delhiensis]SNS90455.1 type VI secretion system protein ImpJ [Pseudomonas delhiensis]